MGGIGSLRLAFKHHDVFGAVVERLPAAYGRRRWPDLLLTLLATDLLVRLFSNRSPLLLPIRHLALLLLARLPPLRQLALAAMTHGPCQLLRQ